MGWAVEVKSRGRHDSEDEAGVRHRGKIGETQGQALVRLEQAQTSGCRYRRASRQPITAASARRHLERARDAGGEGTVASTGRDPAPGVDAAACLLPAAFVQKSTRRSRVRALSFAAIFLRPRVDHEAGGLLTSNKSWIRLPNLFCFEACGTFRTRDHDNHTDLQTVDQRGRRQSHLPLLYPLQRTPWAIHRAFVYSLVAPPVSGSARIVCASPPSPAHLQTLPTAPSPLHPLSHPPLPSLSFLCHHRLRACIRFALREARTTMADVSKGAAVEASSPAPPDIEKRYSSDGEDWVVLATKTGNEQDGADMRRLGKKQQLNVSRKDINGVSKHRNNLLTMMCRGTSIRSPFWA